MTKPSGCDASPQEFMQFDVPGGLELCRFPKTGEWSLRGKLPGGDVHHIRYLTPSEVTLVEAAYEAGKKAK